jgi:hypothetical protein
MCGGRLVGLRVTRLSVHGGGCREWSMAGGYCCYYLHLISQKVGLDRDEIAVDAGQTAGYIVGQSGGKAFISYSNRCRCGSLQAAL